MDEGLWLNYSFLVKYPSQVIYLNGYENRT